MSNQADAIKIACDFISIENLSATQQIANELREHRLAVGSGEDVLQLEPTLWYSWVGLQSVQGVPATEANVGTDPRELPVNSLAPVYLPVQDGFSDPDITMNADDFGLDDASHIFVLNAKAATSTNNRHKRNQQRREEKWKTLDVPTQSGCDFPCPLCASMASRRYHRGGIYCHM